MASAWKPDFSLLMVMSGPSTPVANLSPIDSVQVEELVLTCHVKSSSCNVTVSLLDDQPPGVIDAVHVVGPRLVGQVFVHGLPGALQVAIVIDDEDPALP